MIQPDLLQETFERLGNELVSLKDSRRSNSLDQVYDPLIQKAANTNPWFTKDFIRKALVNNGLSLSKESLDYWLKPYAGQLEAGRSKSIGVVLAGNVPMVGFSDFLCTLFSGNRFLGKLSSDDTVLIPFVAERLISWYPELSGSIRFTQDKLSDFDAVIATGSNNTARYFEYYFRNHPHIIRKNRNGVAVLSGKESTEDLKKLSEDVFLFFGLGCRSVSKLYVPADFDLKVLLEVFSDFSGVQEHTKHMNNYDYYKSIYLINKIPHYDNGFVLLTENTAIASPPAVVYFEYYEDWNNLIQELDRRSEEIQCIVAGEKTLKNGISFGMAQKPRLWDYADGIDTLKFLLDIKS